MKAAAFSAFCIDHYPEQGISKPGGNSLNFAVHAKRCGAETVSVAGFIGTDTYADAIEGLLTTEHIDISHLGRLPGNTASNKLYNTLDGERYSKDGEWDNGVKNAAVLSEKTWDHILSHDIIAVPYLDMNLSELLKRRQSHHLVLVDFMHFDDCDIIRDFLPCVDIAFVSPKPENVSALKNLADQTNKPVITLLGAQGSRAFIDGNEYVQEALEVPKVMDTTGCGDSYQAGFVCSYWVDRDIQKAMRKGAEAASKVLGHFGAV
jgi:fructoselysine 6-kinase